MRKIKVTVQNTDAVQRALKLYGEKAENEIYTAIKQFSLMVDGDVKKAIRSPSKTGVLYYRVPGDKYMTIRAGAIDGPIVAAFKASKKQNLSLTHRSSAPGEAPASDTGGLISSMYFKQKTKLSTEIGSRLPYSYWLEFGTKKIKPRPAWVPAIEKNRPTLEKLVAAAIRRAAQ